jgi:homogentisate 1,2-dioxygenase
MQLVKGRYMGGAAVTGLVRQPAPGDPYRYQLGFGNHHCSEAVPGALPVDGTNLPQKPRYGLYAEHLNGTSFISSRASVSNVYVPSFHLYLRGCHR